MHYTLEERIGILLGRAQVLTLRAYTARVRGKTASAAVYDRQAIHIVGVARLMSLRVHNETDRGGSMKYTWGFIVFMLVTLIGATSYGQTQQDESPREGQQQTQQRDTPNTEQPRQRPGNTSEQRTAQAQVADVLAASWADYANHVPAAMGTRKTVTLQKPVGTLPDGRIVFIRLVTEQPDEVTSVERQAGRTGTSNDGKEGVPGRTWNEKIQRWQDSETGRLLPDLPVEEKGERQNQ